jgi:hypothetical protein
MNLPSSAVATAARHKCATHATSAINKQINYHAWQNKRKRTTLGLVQRLRLKLGRLFFLVDALVLAHHLVQQHARVTMQNEEKKKEKKKGDGELRA